MSASLAFPGSRALAGWWRQLAPYHPEAVWVGHLALHRVEALVDLAHPYPVDRFRLFVLQAVSQGVPGKPAPSAEEHLTHLDGRFHVGRPLLRQVLRSLEAERLVVTHGEGGWLLTREGQEALERGEYVQTTQERRGFHFVEPRRPGDVPHYLNLNSHSGAPEPATESGPPFDISTLEACVARPQEWKERYGFPTDVRAVPGIPADPAAAWRHIIVARPEYLAAALVPITDEREGRRLLGFAARQDGWSLQTSEPAFVVRQSWHELFPELTARPASEAWRQAWAQWCRPRDLPEGEVSACIIEPEGARLVVRAPARLIERLRAVRSDALKGEAWVLVGDGPLRRAALLDLIEQSASGRT